MFIELFIQVLVSIIVLTGIGQVIYTVATKAKK